MAINDVVIQPKSPATGASAGNQSDLFYNVTVEGAFYIPTGSTDTLGGGKPLDGAIRITNGKLKVFLNGAWANADVGTVVSFASLTGSPYDNTNLASALNLKANDSTVVHLAGVETITGAKTFSGQLSISDNSNPVLKLQNSVGLYSLSQNGDNVFRINGNNGLELLTITQTGNISIRNTPTTQSSPTQILTRDATTSEVKYTTLGDISTGVGGDFVHKTGNLAETINGAKTFTVNVTAPTFTGALIGNSDTATKLQTARTINGVAFDGTANITVADATKEPIIAAGTTLQYWRGDKSFQTLNTTVVTEGTNLYFTQSRVLSTLLTGYVAGTNTPLAATNTLLIAFQNIQGQINGITGSSYVNSFNGRTGVVTPQSGDYTTSIVTEGTNLYYTQARFDTAFAGKTTTNLVEGTNLYWTEARGDARITAQKGVANGITPLDSGAKILTTYLPDSILGQLKYGGTYNGTTITASDNFPELQGQNLPTTGAKYVGVFFIATATFVRATVTYETGDWVLHNGSGNYVKVDNTDAVNSVYGRIGNVVANAGDYNTSLVTENTNLYYTEARVSANTNVAANTAARHNAVTLGTANGLSLSTQIISLALSSSTTVGALSSADWNTFNGKQAAGSYVTNVTGTGNIASSGGTTPNITFTGILPVANGGTGSSSGETLESVLNRGKEVSLGTQGFTANPFYKEIFNYGLPTFYSSIKGLNTYANNGGAGLGFFVNGTSTNTPLEALTLRESGFVGIGTNNPLYKLDVNGTGRFSGTVTAPTFIGALTGNATTATTATTFAGYQGNYNQTMTGANTGGLIAFDTSVGYFRQLNLGPLQSWLGLGSNAYTSTAYLPLTGGTLTGALTGTSASFSTGINITGNGGFFNAANKFGLDNNLGASRFYSSGSDVSTKGSYEFHTSNSSGSIDAIAYSIGSTGNHNFGAGTATFGGALTGTSAAFSGDLSTTIGNGLIIGGGSHAIPPSSTRGIISLNGSTDQLLNFGTNSYIYNSSSLFRVLTNTAYDIVVAGTTRLTVNGSGTTLGGALTGTSATFSGAVTASNSSVNNNRIGTVSLGYSGTGYPLIGNNINYTGTSNAYTFIANDSSWGLDFGNQNQFRIRYANGTAGSAISYTDFLTINSGGNATFSGALTGTSASFSGYIFSKSVGVLQLLTSSSILRWELDRDVTETGSNSGSNFTLNRYDDAGGYLGTGFSINRSNGATTLGGALTGTSASFSGSVTASAFYNSSDIRLKKLTSNSFDASKIDLISYKWKDKRDSLTHIGYSAQDVLKFMPDAVSKDDKGFLAVNYIEILVSKVSLLEKRIKELEGRNGVC